MAVPTLGGFAATSTDEKNAATSKREVAQFKAGKGSGKYFAYMSNDRKHITTWTGDKLADVTYYGSPYKMPAFGWPSTRSTSARRASTAGTGPAPSSSRLATTFVCHL